MSLVDFIVYDYRGEVLRDGNSLPEAALAQAREEYGEKVLVGVSALPNTYVDVTSEKLIPKPKMEVTFIGGTLKVPEGSQIFIDYEFKGVSETGIVNLVFSDDSVYLLGVVKFPFIEKTFEVGNGHFVEI